MGNVDVFYRMAGQPDAPTILPHGFPSASHMFRDLIPALADGYQVIAPDLPGFGHTGSLAQGDCTYRFDALANVIDGFVHTIGLDRFAIYISDYGAPVGLRLAIKHPERITAIISQNGNAYLEGLSDEWARGQPIAAARARPTAKHDAPRRPPRRSWRGNTAPVPT